MKKLHFVSLTLLGAACVQTESPIKLGPAYTFQTGPVASTGCIANTSISTGGGSLDISGTANYVVAFGVSSDLQQPQIANGSGTNAGSSTDNDFVINQVLLTYTSTPKLTFAQETVPLAGVVAAQAVQPTDYVGMYIIGPKAAATLAGAAGAGANIELEVTVMLQGALHSGQSEQSTPFTFPISVYSSGFAGCAGVSPILDGPCGNPGGQDGTPLGCCFPSDAGVLPLDCPAL